MSDPDDEMIARLQGAKGLQPRAWLRDNKGLAIAFGLYLAATAAIAGSLIFFGNYDVGPAILFSLFWAPIALMQIWIRSRRRR